MIALRSNHRRDKSRARTRVHGGKSSRPPLRYAVVGLGYIAQVAVLPAFKHATKNSRLTALVSGTPEKLKKLGRTYGVEHLYTYGQYDQLLHSGEIDAVYIALPNSMHAEYAIRAADAGIHVLCEKPMATTEDECLEMIQACQRNNVKLMIAYRLHFEAANLKAVELIQKGKLGEIRLFNSTFCMNVKRGNIRTQRQKGGGTLYDIGIYCINAARYLFGSEPTEVSAFTTSRHDDPRFKDVDDMTGAILRFPNDRIATFVTCFSSTDVSEYRVVGTRGDLRVEPAYDYAVPLRHHLTINGRTRQRTFPKRDQFAPELIYFSNCVHTGENPEPSGEEGLIDVRLIEALYRSAEIGQPISLNVFPPDRRPGPQQEIRRPPVAKPQLVGVEPPSQE